MTNPTTVSPVMPGNTYAAMAAPLRAAFTAAMAPYTNGEAAAPAGLTRILMDAVTAADPTAELIGMLCHLITTAEPDTNTFSIMHRAMGAALGLDSGPTHTGAAAARATTGHSANKTGTTRPGSIGADVLKLFAANPGAEFTVTEIARHVGKGTGATGAAITGLVNRGEAVMTGENPRRYGPAASANAAAPSTSDTPDDASGPDAEPVPAGR